MAHTLIQKKDLIPPSKKRYNLHTIGLVAGALLFAVLIIIPHPTSMDRSGYDVLSSHLPDDVATLIAQDFGVVNDGSFSSFLSYAQSVDIAFSKTSSSIALVRGGSAPSGFESPITLYDAIKRQADAQKLVLALALLMALWWITEAVPVPVTAILPMIFLPLLQVTHYKYSLFPGYFSAFSEYANYLIFLFLGGFVIAAAMRKWGLDQRISLRILSIFGTKPSRIILGFMVATAFLSMWISNTATTALMMPVALAVLTQAKVRPGESRFGLALMLSIAYAASIGGVGTIIGTPPNGIAAGFISQFLGREISFAQWFKIGFPLVIIMLPIAWKYILWRSPPEIDEIAGGKTIISDSRASLGPLSIGERNTLVVFVITALAWATRTSISIDGTTLLPGWSTWFGGALSWAHDSTISIAAILLLFILPVNISKNSFTMDWKTAEKYVPWGTLLLFGGGLTLGKAIANTGMASWIASYLTSLSSVPTLVLLFFIIAFAAMLSEITSNTATTSMLMPVMFALGAAMGKDPLVFMVASAVATSMVFALPVATPPNAIVFGTGYVKIDEMARTGIFLDIIGIVVWSLLLYFVIGIGLGLVII